MLLRARVWFWEVGNPVALVDDCGHITTHSKVMRLLELCGCALLRNSISFTRGIVCFGGRTRLLSPNCIRRKQQKNAVSSGGDTRSRASSTGTQLRPHMKHERVKTAVIY